MLMTTATYYDEKCYLSLMLFLFPFSSPVMYLLSDWVTGLWYWEISLSKLFSLTRCGAGCSIATAAAKENSRV